MDEELRAIGVGPGQKIIWLQAFRVTLFRVGLSMVSMFGPSSNGVIAMSHDKEENEAHDSKKKRRIRKVLMIVMVIVMVTMIVTLMQSGRELE